MKYRKLMKMIPIITVLTYLTMVIINALANIIPINNRGTGEISDSFNNLFTPAPFTFAIWGLIYLWLLLYTVYQLHYYGETEEEKKRVYI